MHGETVKYTASTSIQTAYHLTVECSRRLLGVLQSCLLSYKLGKYQRDSF